jgi:hypothetical protein
MFSSKVISLWKGRETGSTFHFSKCHFRILKAERFDLVVSGLRPATSALRPPILLGRICSGPIANLAHKSPPKIRGGKGKEKERGSSIHEAMVVRVFLGKTLPSAIGSPSCGCRSKLLRPRRGDRPILIDAREVGIHANLNDM